MAVPDNAPQASNEVKPRWAWQRVRNPRRQRRHRCPVFVRLLQHLPRKKLDAAAGIRTIPTNNPSLVSWFESRGSRRSNSPSTAGMRTDEPASIAGRKSRPWPRAAAAGAGRSAASPDLGVGTGDDLVAPGTGCEDAGRGRFAQPSGKTKAGGLPGLKCDP